MLYPWQQSLILIANSIQIQQLDLLMRDYIANAKTIHR